MVITLLSFDRVSFAFDHREICDEASFRLEEGTCAALIGPNGVGKTTLLRLSAGLLRSSAGYISFDGRAVMELGRNERARSIAVVPQQIEVPFDFTVEQIVQQGRAPYLRLFGGPTRQDRMAVERAMDLTDVRPLAHRVFNELSGGERQRVKIALGVAQEPRLLLLDEPTQNLDIGRQIELLDLIASLRDEGITILAAMHDIQLIPETFSAVLLMTDQSLIQGTPDEVLQAAILERAFNCPPQRHPVLVKQKLNLKKQVQ